MNKPKMTKGIKKGFTLLELIIVIIIVGILAAVVYPRYLGSIEKSRLSEGLVALGTLRSAQVRFYNSKELRGLSPVFTSAASDLDADVPPLIYFTTSPVAGTGFNGVCAFIQRTLVSLPAGWGAYRMGMTGNASIYCDRNGGSVDACARLGYIDTPAGTWPW